MILNIEHRSRCLLRPVRGHAAVIRVLRSTGIVMLCCIGLLGVHPPETGVASSFTCPGMKFVGPSSSVIDPGNSSACTVTSPIDSVALDGTLNAFINIGAPFGIVTSDEHGHLLRITDSDGRTTSLEALPGQLSSIINPSGGITTFQYDASDRLFKNIDPLGFTTMYQYDASGRLISDTDPLGRVTRYQYDASGRLVRDIDPLGQVTIFNYTVPEQPVPEPSTLLLLGSGLVGLAGYGKKKFFKK